jgi:hypothetical protein
LLIGRLPFGNQTWQWENSERWMKRLATRGIVHCHVWLPLGKKNVWSMVNYKSSWKSVLEVSTFWVCTLDALARYLHWYIRCSKYMVTMVAFSWAHVPRKHGNRTAIAGRGCTDRPKKNLGDCFGGIAYVAYGLGKTRAMCNEKRFRKCLLVWRLSHAGVQALYFRSAIHLLFRPPPPGDIKWHPLWEPDMEK